jgi:ubiquinone biosynthesis protein COQ9
MVGETGMINLPERSAARDDAIRAMLAHVPFDGWTERALRAGLADLREPPEMAHNLFPDGPVGVVEAWCDLADREMEAAAGQVEPRGSAERVRALLMLRLRQLRPHREALRRALALLARPGNVRAAARITARTVDAIWYAAGDRATDFNCYTKRASLAAIYAATVLYWLGDESGEEAATFAFLDRRLASVAAIGKLRRRLADGCTRFSPARRTA